MHEGDFVTFFNGFPRSFATHKGVKFVILLDYFVAQFNN